MFALKLKSLPTSRKGSDLSGAQTIKGVTRHGTRYEYCEGPGPVVVFIHGLGLNLEMWQWQVETISAHYSVLTYDLSGSGKSSRSIETPSLTVFSNQLVTLLDELKIEKAVIAGFSLGGMIARRFAMDHPDYLLALAILNSAYKRDQSAHDAIQNRVYQARSDGPQATVEAALDRWFSSAYRQANPNVMNFVRDAILANDKSVYPTIYQVLVDGVDELVRPSPPITCPTLVMTAEEDFGNSVEMTHAIAAEIPDAQTVILPGLRHMAMVEEPDLFNENLLKFLERALENENRTRGSA